MLSNINNQSSKSRLGVASLIFGLLSILLILVLPLTFLFMLPVGSAIFLIIPYLIGIGCSILAIIIGIVALIKVKDKNLRNKLTAIIGIVSGFILF